MLVEEGVDVGEEPVLHFDGPSVNMALVKVVGQYDKKYQGLYCNGTRNILEGLHYQLMYII